MVVFKKEFEEKLKKQQEQDSFSAAKTALERSAAKQVQSSQKAAAPAAVLPGTDSRFSLPGTSGLLQTVRAETVQSLLPEREIRSPMQILSQSPGVQTMQSVSQQQMADRVSTDFQSTNRLSGLPSIDSLRRRPDVTKFGAPEGAMEAEPERMLELFVRQYNQQESRPYTITVDDKGRYSLEAVGDYEAEKKQIASDLSSLSGQIALTRQKFDTESRERLAELLERSEQLRTRQSELEAFPSEYYTLENVLQQFNLNKDPEAVKLYREAEEAQIQLAQLDLVLELLHNPEPLEDRDPWAVAAEVMKAHGLTEQDLTDNGVAVARVHEQLTDHLTDLEQQLQEQGFDFARMSGYQQKLAEDEAAQQTQTEQARFAKEHPVASTLASVLRSPLQGVEFVGKAVEQIGNDPDDPATYVPPSTADMLNTNFVNTVRGAVSEEIAQAYDWELFGQNVAAFLYQTGLSAVDSAATVGVLGPAATVVLGGSAAASTTADIINRGGTSEQAILGGLAAGVAEGLFEKVSIDNLLKPGDVVNVRTWAREVVKQSGIEASEEAMTEIANILSDSIIMGQNSSFSQLVAAYEAQGLSKEEAKQKALLDNIGQVAWAATGGALAGGMTGSVYRAVQGVQQSQASKAQLDAVGEAVRAANQTQDEIRKAQLLQVDGAADLAARQVTGGKISNRELGELTVANQAAAEQLVHTALESPDPAVRSLATQMLTSEGEAVTLRPVRSETVAALQAAMDGPAATQSDATAATETTPKMNTLDSITTGFTDMGMKLSTAEKKAAVMQKLMAGDTVTDKELATIDPTNKQVQALFSQLTGVTFPERGTSVETLRQLFRSAPEVMARQAETVVAEPQTEAVPDFQTWQTQNPVTELQKAQAREILAREMGNVMRDGSPVVGYTEFKERYRAANPGADDAAVAGAYQQFLHDEQTVRFGGRQLNRNEFREVMRQAPGSDQLTDTEIEFMFDRVKDGNEDFAEIIRLTKQKFSDNAEHRAVEAAEQERRTKLDATVKSLKSTLSGTLVKDIVLEDSIERVTGGKKVNAFVDLKTGVVHLNRQVLTSEQTLHFYLGHELTHLAKESAGDAAITDILDTFRKMEADGLIPNPALAAQVRSMDQWLEEVRERYGEVMEGDTKWTAEEEIAGDLMGSIFGEPEVLNAFTRAKPGLVDRIVQWLRGLVQKLRKSDSNQELTATLEQLGDRFAEALKQYDTKSLENETAVDTESEIRLSIEFDQQFMDNADQKNNGMVPQAVMEQARQDREKIAAYLNEFRTELQLPPDVMGNTWSGNSFYDGSEENTTVCIRTLAADALMDAIAEKVERPLTVQDTLLISQELFNFTDKPECLYCYVAQDRKSYREMMGRYIQQRDAALADLRAGMPYDEAYEKFLAGRKDTKPMRDRFKMWSEAGELISLSDLASPKRMAEAASRGSGFAKQIRDAHKYSFAATHAKGRVGFAAYNNHILGWTQQRINSLNSHYGMRMYSFSDYSPAFILEDMQRVTDAAVRGLKGLAYTKELDFVRIFAPSGMNINVSVFGYDDGNGGVAQDGMQGADWAETQALREQFPNVGATFVATNDTQVEWALEQDWIDVIIPFHTGRTGDEVAAYFGWTNYKHMSDDVKRVKDGWTKGRDAKSIYPREHQNNKEMYLAACEDNHLTPRFEKWVDHPNYMKLVNETRMAEAASQPLQPVFNTEAAMESLERMKKQGGYYVPVGGSVEEMLGIAEEIAEKLPKDVRYSLSTEVNSGGKRLTVEQAEFFRDSKVRDAEGRLLVMYHGTANGGPFTVFNPEKLSLSSRTSQQGPGFYFTNVQRWAREYTKDVDIFTGKARKGVAPNLFKTYLNITNPLELQRGVRTLTDEQVSALIRSSTYEWARGYWKWQLLDDKTVSDETAYAAFVDRARKWDDKNVVSELVQWFNSGTELLNAMQAITGYDGIHEHVRAGEQEGEIYVAFSPEQIKNVDNKMPTSDPDIRYSLSEETDSTGAPLTIGQASFFEASKARDDQGHLVRLYHGTGADFTVFDMSRAGKNFPNRGGDLGAYFTPFWDTAHGYATNFSEEGRVETVYLNLKNPLIVEDDGWGSAIAQIDTRSSDLRRWALSGGHDGIIVRSLDYEMDDAGTPDTVYVAFSPEQIKRIDNLTPTADPDIRYSISDELSFDEQVRQTLHGGLQLEGVGENPSALYVMKEPTALLQEVGFGDYPLVITQNHVQAITAQRWDENGQILPGADHNHQISEELFARLPELIQSDVAAIFKANRGSERTRGSIILLTTQTDSRGNPVVIALRPNGTNVAYDGKLGPAHIVTSMYGREHFDRWLDNQVKHDTILYVNEKKARAVPVGTFGDKTLASWYADLNPQGFNTIVGQRDATVNRENVGRRRYSISPEFREWFIESEGLDPDAKVDEARVQRALERKDKQTRQAKAAAKSREANANLGWRIYSEQQLRLQKQKDKAKLREALGQAREEKRSAVAQLEEIAAIEKALAVDETGLGWQMGHLREMRELKRSEQARREAAVQAERTEAKEQRKLDRQVAQVEKDIQHQGDVMAEKRMAAKRLGIREDAYTRQGAIWQDNLKLRRNAAKAALRSHRKVAEIRARQAVEQGAVDTIRKDPQAAAEVSRLQAAANKLRTLGRSAYRGFVSDISDLERFGKRQVSSMRADTLATVYRGANTTVESLYKVGLFDRSGNRVGDSMQDVFLVKDSKGKVDPDRQALLQDYMLHRHNIDRMSFESRSRETLEAFEAENPWLAEMDKNEFARLVALTDHETAQLGKEPARTLAREYYLLLKQVAEARNKPIFADDKGQPVTADTSRAIVEDYEANHDWLRAKAQGIYAWWDQFMRLWAVGDSLSLEQYEQMRSLYPSYVPTYRLDKGGIGSVGFVGMGGATIGQAVKRAKGGTSTVMAIEDSFSDIAQKIVRQARLNEVYKNILDTLKLDEDGTFGDFGYYDWTDAGESDGGDVRSLLESEAEQESRPALTKEDGLYKLTAWEDGKKISAFISEDLFKSIYNLSGQDSKHWFYSGVTALGNKLTGPMKTAITGVNPAFALRNLSRDLPTAVVNSVSGLAFPKYYAQAALDMAAAGALSKDSLRWVLDQVKADTSKMQGRADRWAQFKALGGVHSGYYNNESGFAKQMSTAPGIGQRALSTLGAFNEATEAMTRFAEYLATIERKGDTYENRLQGIKNAAEVTVDFGRRGSVGKVLNAWIPYWNPAMQGVSRLIRSVAESDRGHFNAKKALGTVGRAGMMVVLPQALIMAAIMAAGREDEWEQFDDRTKDTYYLIPLADHQWLKVPKNREWGAILGAPLMRMWEAANGRDDAFETYLETSIIPNFLPGGPLDIIGLSQAVDLLTNEDFAGRSIVPYSLAQGSRGEQWDGDTSLASKWFADLWNAAAGDALTEALGADLTASPMQLDYILGDYFGDFADIFRQWSSVSTWSGDDPVRSMADAAMSTVTTPWIANELRSNQAVSDYYDLLDRLAKEVQDAATEDSRNGTELKEQSAAYQAQKAIQKLYGDRITKLYESVNGTPDEAEQNAYRAEIAALAGEALRYYEDIQSGKIQHPVLEANYADLPGDVSDELIRLDGMTEDYSFLPITSVSKTYTVPGQKYHQYELTDDQRQQFKDFYMEVYGQAMSAQIQSAAYQQASDAAKAEMLEATRDTVLEQTKERFFLELETQGVSAVQKELPMELPVAVANELYRLDSYTADYSFTPTGSAGDTFADPRRSDKEYVLTAEQKLQYKAIYQEVYGELMAELMAKSRYKSAKDAKKAALLEEERDKVLEETKDRFYEWLRETGAEPVEKE